MVATNNPILARRYRGGELESIHRGAWAVVDTDGAVVAAAGDPDQPIFARSSSKSLQAAGVLPLGLVDEYALTPEHLAVMISSHNGEPVHVGVVESLLAAAGLDASALQCGPAHRWGHAQTERRSICHCCSGKHAGFLAAAVHLGQDPATYLDADSAVQQHIRHAVQRITDTADSDLAVAIDGCSAPTFVLPLRALAQGIARIANPSSLDGDDAASATAMVAAAQAHPHLVAGSEPLRFDTAIMRATNGRLFAKGGADGVRVLGVQDAGIAFVGKVDDGNDRGLVPVAIEVLARLGHVSETEAQAVSEFVDPVIRNAAGLAAGEQLIDSIDI